MPAADDPLLEGAARLAAELRERCAARELGAGAEELLVGGYASALALEGARRRLRAQALDATERELALAVRERELRALLRTLRRRLGEGAASAASDDEPASQRLHRRL